MSHRRHYEVEGHGDELAHPGAPAGGGGPGNFRMPGPRLDVASTGTAPHPDAPAARHLPWHDFEHAIRREDASELWRRLQASVDANDILSIVRPVLDQRSFELGFIVGAASNIRDMTVALASLMRVFVLAGLYDAANGKAGAGLGVLYLQAKAIQFVAGDALRKAHDERDKLLGELWHAVTHARATLLAAGGQIAASYQAKWDRLLALHADRSLRARYEEGRITGEVMVDVLLLILTVVDGVGAAKALAELPALTKIARGMQRAGGAVLRNEAEATASATTVRAAQAGARRVQPEAIDAAAEARSPTPRSATAARIVSRAEAEGMLVESGLSQAKAKDFVASFEGPITARTVAPGEQFLRYSDLPDSKGSFLTKQTFSSPADAVGSLYLGPYGNEAKLAQPVLATKASTVLEGAVAHGVPPGTIQTLIVDRTGFTFGTGVPYP
jgi:hypothetical protein